MDRRKQKQSDIKSQPKMTSVISNSELADLCEAICVLQSRFWNISIILLSYWRNSYYPTDRINRRIETHQSTFASLTANNMTV